MTKNDFAVSLNLLLQLKKDTDNLNNAFKKIEPDFNYISFGRYESLVVKLLATLVGDKAGWIEYFLYERDCKFTKRNIITSRNGKNLPLRNVEDLYNLITKHK